MALLLPPFEMAILPHGTLFRLHLYLCPSPYLLPGMFSTADACDPQLMLLAVAQDSEREGCLMFDG